MSMHAQQPSFGPGDPCEQRHPLDGIRLRLPVPSGRHPTEVVASLARLLCRRHNLEPFDLQVLDPPDAPGGTLSLCTITPDRRLALYVKRSQAAVQRASSVSVSAGLLQIGRAHV